MRVGEAKVALQAFVEDPESERTDERLSANEKSLNERLHGAGGRPLPEKKAPGARGKWGPAEAEEGGGPRRRTKER